MSDFGILATGFNRKRLDLILNSIDTEMRGILGENANLLPASPDGQVNGVVAGSFSDLWDIAEASFNAFNPASAKGVALSNLVRLNGIKRIAASATTVLLTLTGTPGTFAPAGTLVSTADTGVQFSTLTDATLPGGGSGTVYAFAVQDGETLTGPVLALAGTVTVMDTPISGWTGVTNLADAVVGVDEESDSQLRARRERSVARDAQNVVEAIIAEILAVPGVTSLTVLSNDTINTVANLPPHHLHAIVLGGTDSAVAKAITLKKGGGQPTLGNTAVVLTDSQGIDFTINLTRPGTVTIFIEIDLTKNSGYPATGDADIKQAIVDYSNGVLFIGDILLSPGFGTGDTVIYSQLYTAINLTPGHTVASLTIGVAVDPTAKLDIPIAFDKVSNIVVGNIEII